MTDRSLGKSPLRLLGAVGSRPEQVCSIGAFARLETNALGQEFSVVELTVPSKSGEYPASDSGTGFDVLLMHLPALHDRGRPWNPFFTLFKLKSRNPRAKVFQVVHEFSEAPAHWRLRQAILARLMDGVICNTKLDAAGLERFARKITMVPLAPVLSFSGLDDQNIQARIQSTRERIANKFELPISKRWVVSPGLITPGKGLEFFEALVADARFDAELILMGSFGPLEADKKYAETLVSKLKAKIGNRLHVIIGPSDEDFRDVQFASDLVALPFEQGVSERRSSWLASMATACNIWTTTGPYAEPLKSELAQCWTSPLEASDTEGRIQKILAALNEDQQNMIRRRLKNLSAVEHRGWSHRARALRKFISEA